VFGLRYDGFSAREKEEKEEKTAAIVGTFILHACEKD